MRASGLLHRLAEISHELRDDSLDAVAMQALAPLAGEFLPWSTSTMRPSAILAVLTLVAINRFRVVVECGSGNSTIYIARLMSQYEIPGHVYSLDHDRKWAELTHDRLASERLEQWVTVTHAPLVDGWYDRAKLPAVRDIELLVVDGPPAYDGSSELSRAPALDAFYDQLAPTATVVLDDASRRGERRVTDLWRKDYGLAMTRERSGHAIGTLNKSAVQAIRGSAAAPAAAHRAA